MSVELEEKFGRALWLVRRFVWKVLGLFVPFYRFWSDLLDALEEKEGAVYFTWTWDGNDPDVDGLISDIDEEVRQLPSPLGADEFFVRVWVYGSRPEDDQGVEDDTRGRRLLRVQSFTFDRYYDWNKGDGRERLRGFLEDNVPSPEVPLVVIGIFPLGGALRALLQDGRYSPMSSGGGRSSLG